MSNPLQHLKDRFKDKLKSEEGELKPIESSPEILGEQYFSCGVITGHRKNQIFIALEKEGQVAFCAEMMIHCVMDSNRERQFEPGSRRQLMNECESTDIETIAGEISQVIFGTDDIEQVILNESMSEAVVGSKGDSRTGEERAAAKNLKKTSN